MISLCQTSVCTFIWQIPQTLICWWPFHTRKNSNIFAAPRLHGSPSFPRLFGDLVSQMALNPPSSEAKKKAEKWQEKWKNLQDQHQHLQSRQDKIDGLALDTLLKMEILLSKLKALESRSKSELRASNNVEKEKDEGNVNIKATQSKEDNSTIFFLANLCISWQKSKSKD